MDLVARSKGRHTAHRGSNKGTGYYIEKVRVLVNLVRLFRAPTEGLIGLATGTCFGSVPNSVGLSVQLLGWAAPPRGSAHDSDCPSKWERQLIKPGKVDPHSDVQSRDAKEQREKQDVPGLENFLELAREREFSHVK